MTSNRKCTVNCYPRNVDRCCASFVKKVIICFPRAWPICFAILQSLNYFSLGEQRNFVSIPRPRLWKFTVPLGNQLLSVKCCTEDSNSDLPRHSNVPIKLKHTSFALHLGGDSEHSFISKEIKNNTDYMSYHIERTNKLDSLTLHASQVSKYILRFTLIRTSPSSLRILKYHFGKDRILSYACHSTIH